jgi:hypothetical protein
VAELLEDVVGAHALRHLRKLRLGKISLQAREKTTSPLTVLGKGLRNFPWQSFSKMSLVLRPYGIFGSSASENFPCKPVKDSISSNSVG